MRKFCSCRVHTLAAKQTQARLQQPMLDLELTAQRKRFTTQVLQAFNTSTNTNTAYFPFCKVKINDDWESEFSSATYSSPVQEFGLRQSQGDLRILSATRD